MILNGKGHRQIIIRAYLSYVIDNFQFVIWQLIATTYLINVSVNDVYQATFLSFAWNDKILSRMVPANPANTSAK